MRSEFQKLDSFDKWSKEYKKMFNTQIDFLRKKCANIDTRLYSTSQLVEREIER